MPTPTALEPGRIIGQYRIVRKIGEGGFGMVFECVHQTIDRRAALKVLHLELGIKHGLGGRFFQEARAANRVSHPGVVQIFDCGQLADGTLWLLMEYVDGETLHARLELAGQSSPHTLGMDALPVLHQLAAILSVAHRQGIVHRDLKPSNVMLVPDRVVRGGDRVRLLDFGIAKLLGEAVEAGHKPQAIPCTEVGTFLGTPAYMAPEQARSAGDVNDRADVYALGVIAYQAVTGRLPLDAPTPIAILMRKAAEVPPPPREFNSNISPALDQQISAMLSLDPTARPSMATVEQAWDAMLEPSNSWHKRRVVANDAPDLFPQANQSASSGGGANTPRSGPNSPISIKPSPPPERWPPGEALASKPKVVPPTLLPPATAGPVEAAAPENKPVAPVPISHSGEPAPSPPSLRSGESSPSPPSLQSTRPATGRLFTSVVLGLTFTVALIGAIRAVWQTRQPVPPPTVPDASAGQLVADLRAAHLAAVVDLAVLLPDLSRPAPDLATPPPDLATPPRDLSTKTVHQPPPACVLPKASCIKTASLLPGIKERIARAFVDAQVALCANDRVVIVIRANEPWLVQAPDRVRRDERTLRVALRGRLPSIGITDTFEIQCKR